jgi:hypothetical protein
MTNLKNSGVLLCILATSVSFILPAAALAQGLKGAQMPPEIQGRLSTLMVTAIQNAGNIFLPCKADLSVCLSIRPMKPFAER